MDRIENRKNLVNNLAKYLKLFVSKGYLTSNEVKLYDSLNGTHKESVLKQMKEKVSEKLFVPEQKYHAEIYSKLKTIGDLPERYNSLMERFDNSLIVFQDKYVGPMGKDIEEVLEEKSFTLREVGIFGDNAEEIKRNVIRYLLNDPLNSIPVYLDTYLDLKVLPFIEDNKQFVELLSEYDKLKNLVPVVKSVDEVEFSKQIHEDGEIQEALELSRTFLSIEPCLNHLKRLNHLLKEVLPPLYEENVKKYLDHVDDQGYVEKQLRYDIGTLEQVSSKLSKNHSSLIDLLEAHYLKSMAILNTLEI